MTKSLCFILFAVVAGAAADLMCVSMNFVPRCNPLKVAEDFCPNLPKLVQCIQELAAECDVASSPQTESLVKAMNDLCQENSSLNTEFKKQETCMKNFDPNHVRDCSFPAMAEIMRSARTISQDQNLGQRQVFAIICRHSNEMNQCLVNVLVKECGSESGEFFNQINDVFNSLNQQACLENNNYLDGLPKAERIAKRALSIHDF